MEKKLEENNPDWAQSLEMVPKARHMCWLYETDDERTEIVNQYLAEALARKKQCMLVVTAAVKKEILLKLKELDLNVSQYLETEQIISIEPQDFFFDHGQWDIERLVSRLDSIVTTSKKNGWEGLAMVNDAAESIDSARNEDWAAWEFHADYECLSRRCTMLCLYDLGKISGLLLASLIKSHPIVGLGKAIARNPFHVTIDSPRFEKH